MKKKLICITTTMMIVALSGCGSKDNLILNTDVFNVELGQSISTHAKTYLSKDTDKDVLKKAKVTFNKNKAYTQAIKDDVLKPTTNSYVPVGKYQAKITYQDEHKKLTVQVKDTTPPKFTKSDDITMVVNSKSDLVEMFKAEDLSPVTITVDKGKLDISKVGSYKINVIATDQYKNKSAKQAMVNIIEQPAPTPQEPQAPVGTAQSNGNTGTASGSGGGTVSKPSGGSNAPSGNTGGGSSSGDTCVPIDNGNAGRIFSSWDEAANYAKSLVNSNENIHAPAGEFIQNYGIFTAGCGCFYIEFIYG